MTDQEQLIAVAEVLGYTPHSVRAHNSMWFRPGEKNRLLERTVRLGNWLTSLDACFADIVPAMKKEGWLFDLENSSGDPESWCCGFFKTAICPIMATAPTAPRAIVKAFLMHNNRWVDQPDNQRKGDWRESTDSKPLIIP